MMQNFNFYDVYGYLLPGITLLLMFWLPIGITTKSWPSAALSSAIFGVAFAYVAGHILQILAINAFPPTLKASRYPSDIFLEETDRTFTDRFKELLKERIKATCTIDVDSADGQIDMVVSHEQSGGTNEQEIRHIRRDAFFMCRNVLIQGKAMGYAEQAQGMYALMLGLAVAFGLGSLYQLGWSSSGWVKEGFELYVWMGIIVTLLLAIGVVISTVNSDDTEKTSRRFRLGLVILVMTAFLLGFFLGAGRATEEGRGLLLLIGLTSLLASMTCYTAYKYFIAEYAKAVYYAFSTYEKTEGKKRDQDE